jgi:hypothetical protein
MVAKRITTEMKARPIDSLTGREFDKFYSRLGTTLGANTIRQTQAVLHATFDQAVKWQWFCSQPHDECHTAWTFSSPSARRWRWVTFTG